MGKFLRVVEVASPSTDKKVFVVDKTNTSPIKVLNTSWYSSIGGNIIDIDCDGKHLNPALPIGKWFTFLLLKELPVTSSKRGFKVYWVDKKHLTDTLEKFRPLSNKISSMGGFTFDVLTKKGGASNMDYALNSLSLEGKYDYYTFHFMDSFTEPITEEKAASLNQFIRVLKLALPPKPKPSKKVKEQPKKKDLLEFKFFLEKYGGKTDYNQAIFNYGIYLGHSLPKYSAKETLEEDVRRTLPSNDRVEKTLKYVKHAIEKYF